ncbi:MAG: ankyrin repeat domain-containing protein [Spirochaetes bacterium]|nr:ankyrin repeat domain-containing protein [Spirochaetota bacterium]
MNVAVLASPDDAHFIPHLLKAFRSIDVDAYGLKIQAGWVNEDRARLDAALFKATHFLAVLSPATVSSTWFPFIAGYGHAYGRRLALFRENGVTPVPPFVGSVALIESVDDLMLYYGTEKAEWFVFEERRTARATLLEMGVSFHEDALVASVSGGDLEAVRLFIRGGFNPDIRDRHGVPLLNLAIRSKHLNEVELLVECGAGTELQSEDRGYSPLMDAVKVGTPEIIAYLLSIGVDTNLVSKDGQTALIIAVGRNDIETARKLLDAGADPDLADKLGLSARKYASLFHNPDMTALFPQP